MLAGIPIVFGVVVMALPTVAQVLAGLAAVALAAPVMEFLMDWAGKSPGRRGLRNDVPTPPVIRPQWLRIVEEDDEE